jgi:ATP-binding cassette subfamily B protein
MFFIIAAILQGLTLGLMIPSSGNCLGDQRALWPWTITIVIAGAITVVVHVAVLIHSYRVSVYEICGTSPDYRDGSTEDPCTA